MSSHVASCGLHRQGERGYIASMVDRISLYAVVVADNSDDPALMKRELQREFHTCGRGCA